MRRGKRRAENAHTFILGNGFEGRHPFATLSMPAAYTAPRTMVDPAAPELPTIAYTDGSCIGNPGPGGWGVHVEAGNGRVLELGGGELDTTNNRMELRAAIEALRATAGCPAVAIITDSSYVRNGITRWLMGWKRDGWQTKAGKPVSNRELWIELDALARPEVIWQWTRAHVGTPGNERCDAIARSFAVGIRRLDPGGHPTLSAASGEPSSSLARRPRAQPTGTRYLSLVDGVVAQHATWSDCEQRVHGVRGARYRKVNGDDEARALLKAWGLSPELRVQDYRAAEGELSGHGELQVEG